jgi:hypothetical protein
MVTLDKRFEKLIHRKKPIQLFLLLLDLIFILNLNRIVRFIPFHRFNHLFECLGRIRQLHLLQIQSKITQIIILFISHNLLKHGKYFVKFLDFRLIKCFHLSQFVHFKRLNPLFNRIIVKNLLMFSQLTQRHILKKLFLLAGQFAPSRPFCQFFLHFFKLFRRLFNILLSFFWVSGP